jgi:hypothetical protein
MGLNLFHFNMPTFVQNIATFYKRNRLPIIIGLAIVVLLQWCQLQAEKKYRLAQPSTTEQVAPLKPEVAPPSNAPQQNPWMPYLLMVGMVLLVFVAQRRGWLMKLFPRIVIIKGNPFVADNKQMLRIFFMNAKKENISFDAPIVEFLKLGKTKSFKLSMKAGDVMFPLTLTTSTAHSMVVDLEKIYAASPEVRRYPFVRVRMTVNGKRMAKSWPRIVWPSFKQKKQPRWQST